MKVNFVYITADSNEEAERIGEELLKSKLAACVNIFHGMNSMYMWEGELRCDFEVVVIAKTAESRVPELIEKVKSLHSYDCPCIVALPVSNGNPDFMEWIAAETSNHQS